jgi:hypothetical protein
MERLLLVRRKVNDPIDATGTAIDLDLYNINVIPIKFLRAVRLRIETDLKSNNNLVKSLLILLELNGSDVDVETLQEVIALGRLNNIQKDYIEKFFQYFDEVVEQLSGAANLVTLVYKENEDFRP